MLDRTCLKRKHILFPISGDKTIIINDQYAGIKRKGKSHDVISGGLPDRASKKVGFENIVL